jgi:murein L,D-transpeptidase YafK
MFVRARSLAGFLAKRFAVVLLLSCLSSAEEHLAARAHANRVLILKQAHTLTLLDHGKVLKKYRVALGGDPVGPKSRQGDHKTPEGVYELDHRNEHSQFYRSIHISYPNAQDRARARKSGVAPGGDVMIHGLPNGYGWIGSGHRSKDWTDGCIAVTNAEMDEIWSAVPDGTPIEIRP